MLTLEEHIRRLKARAALPSPESSAHPAIDPSVRDRVNDCPDRGGILPISLQDPGCGCGELSSCAAGKGKTPGRVGLRDCLLCKA